MTAIALATCETLPGLFLDDQLLMLALRQRGVEAFPLVWSSAEAAMAKPEVCVLRNTWDYYHRPAAFLAWAEGMAQRSRLLNPFPLVRWNAHKGYLLDLATRKVPTVPTLLARQGRPLPVAALAMAAAWTAVVIKPAISAGAHRTLRFEAADPQAQAHLEALVQDGDALIQPYLPSVEAYGERSFLFIGGRYTHAVKRTQALTEGVGIERLMDRVEATEAEMAVCSQVLATLPECVPGGHPAYARIDLAPDADGRPLLMEVEAIEPRLFLQECPEAIEAFADLLVMAADIR